MKLISYLDGDTVRPGLVEGETVYSLAPLCDSILGLLDAHGTEFGVIRDARASGKLPEVGRLSSLHLKPPVCYPRKLLCVAGNYVAHITEGGRSLKPEHTQAPWLFCVPPTTVMIGHGEPIRLHPQFRKIDYEGELAVVIGRAVKGVSAEEAGDAIAGRTIYNDVSERTPYMIEHVAERRDLSFWYTKSFDTFGPTGPWMVTRDEVPDPQNVTIRVAVNGEERQNCSTSQMIFSINEIIAFLSGFLTLEPGDILATGTPSGVGLATGRYLAIGDTVTIRIDGVGILENRVEGMH